MKVTPDTPIVEGQNIVRVGADAVPCPRGATHYLYPVVQLIWPVTEQQVIPEGNITIRWQDKLDADKPSKSPNPKYIGLMLDSGEQWVGYRVSENDRLLFESLRKKWGMWFLRARRQDEEKDVYWLYFNDGGHFPGGIINMILEQAERFTADELRSSIQRAWEDTLKTLRAKAPQWLPETSRLKLQMERILRIPTLLEEIGGGPLPWKPKEMPWWGKPDNKAHEYVVENYLMVLRALKQNWGNKKVKEKFRTECGAMYNYLRKARIFEITPESYNELHISVDRHVTEDIAHLKFYDPREGHVDVPEEEGILLHKRQAEALQRLPFPDKLPFDTCWFALTGGIALSQLQAETRGLDPGEYMLVGIIAEASGEHHEILISKGYIDHGETWEMNLHISTHHVQEFVMWNHKLCLAPFVLHGLVDCINDHHSTVIAQRKPSLHTISKFKNKLGDLGIKQAVPPMFYTVYLRDKVIREISKGYSGGKLRAKLSHRFDVRGHWCCKIYRGYTPMDVELELDLDNKKYSIYKDRPVDEWVRNELRERDMALPQPGEWLAIKRFWKKDYVKGPENAQYIPSTRRATKGVLAFDNDDVPEENVFRSHDQATVETQTEDDKVA